MKIGEFDVDAEIERVRSLIYARIDARLAIHKARMKHGVDNRRSAGQFLRWTKTKAKQ